MEPRRLKAEGGRMKKDAPNPRASVSSFILHPSSLSSAFTLIELLLVMVIIAIIIGEAVPNLRGFLIGSRLENAANNLVASCNYARTEAISQGRTYQISVDSNNYDILYEDVTQQKFVSAGTSIARHDSLGDIRVSLSRDDQSPGDHVNFYADGTTEPATFTLVQPNGGTSKIVCLSPSERFHVVKGETR
jgi:type II secretion system protein H